jgi:hypothetical protein
MKSVMVVGGLAAGIMAVGVARADPINFCDIFSAPCTSALLANEWTFEQIADTGSTHLSSLSDEVVSDFGVNRIFASSLDAIVESQFLEPFVVMGGSGSGVMTVRWQLEGQLSIPGASAECSGPTDPDVIEDDPGCRMAIRFLGQGAFPSPLPQPIVLRNPGGAASKTVQLTGSVDVPFTYGVPFVGGFVLSGETRETDGTLDFFNTGGVTALVLPAGASVQTGSGTEYPIEQVAGPADLLGELMTAVQTLNLPRGITNGLDAKLSNALQALDATGGAATPSACGMLHAFAHEVQAQVGKTLTHAQAVDLLATSAHIRGLLGC